MYPELDNFVRTYLHQDYFLFGETMGDIIAYYVENNGAADTRCLKNDVLRFRAAHPQDLEAAFRKRYENDFNPAGWDLSAMRFFSLLETRLQEPR